MLRKIRIALAAVMFILINLLFLSVTWSLTTHIGWVAKIQFLPALLALNFAVLAALVLLTLFFGRIYCSIICPLGVMQDVFGWLGKKQKKNRYSYSPEKKWLRYGMLAIFIICLILGFAPVTTLLAPYSAYGRIVNSLFRPLYDLLQNALASIESGYDSYMFSTVELWMRNVTTFIIALLTLIILGFLSWRNGRTYCNTICPVGTILSFFSRFSLLRIQFDKDKCTKCSLCMRNCKASAIDYQAGTVDYSRCVTCGDCTEKCKFDALHYSLKKREKDSANTPTVQPEQKSSVQPRGKKETIDENRRAFLIGSAMAVGTAAIAQTKIKVDGGLAVIEEKKAPHRETKITPPGSISIRHLEKHCTACQLCVSACPNNVLRPSTDTMHFMQPVLSFERGYCRPDCTHCSKVCPAGAIKPINRNDKTAIHIGRAVWIAENCVPVVNNDSCGACARHCPAWAIHMVDYTTKDGRAVQVPAVDAERCIGCGKCENLCPARPFSAIYVEGNEVHHIS